MTPEELHATCEMAGLPKTRKSNDVHTSWIIDPEGPQGQQWLLHHYHPALPAFVAELLVAKVRDYVRDSMAVAIQSSTTGNIVFEAGLILPESEWYALTAEQRIRAAMSVLEQES